MQCGFCTPGMVMSCAALVERNPECTLEDVKAAVSGHLCRCGTYPNVFAATLAAAQAQSERKSNDEAVRSPPTYLERRRTGRRCRSTSIAGPRPLREQQVLYGIVGDRTGAGDAARAGRRAAAARPRTRAEGDRQAPSRLDAVQKVTGKARYTFDVQLPGMLYARRVVSTLAHARVISRRHVRG